jgi:hypothetical protein
MVNWALFENARFDLSFAPMTLADSVYAIDAGGSAASDRRARRVMRR